MKSMLVLIVLGAALAIVPACGDDDPTAPVRTPVPWPPVSGKWQVLRTMELAISRRNLQRYEELLDDNFTFYLANSDVLGGLPESWDREIEIHANANLFSTEQPPAPMKHVLSLHMDIQWEDDRGKPNVAWIELTPPNSSETWYTTTVFFNFQVDVEGDLTYISNPGTQAQFTVRNAGTEEGPVWKLVEMRDLGSSSGPATTSRSTEPATWGGIKAGYR